MSEWKPVKGYEGLYEVSSAGHVRGLDREIKYFDSVAGKDRVRMQYGKTLSGSNTGNGYRSVMLCDAGQQKKRLYIHRLVAGEFIENPENKSQVNHINGDKTDNRVENLEWSTRLENMHHGLANGLNRYGKIYEAYA